MNDSYPSSSDAQEPGHPSGSHDGWSGAPNDLQSGAERVATAAEAVPEEPSFDLAEVSSRDKVNLSEAFAKGYDSPRSARETSRRLIDAYDDQGLLLAASVQPHHLHKELSCNCSDLTRLVVLQWVRQGEIQKLKLLGDALLTTPDAQLNRETARVMMLLGGLLGILRPQAARKLVDRAAPLLREPADVELVNDAMPWVQAGELLGSSPPEERIFWNRRLREPSADWDWNQPESRLALSHLAAVLPREEVPGVELFQNAVPGIWWDLWRSRPPLPEQPATPLLLGAGAPSPTAPTTPPPPARRIGFGIGLASGLAAAILVLGAAAVLVPLEEETDAAPDSSSPSSPALPPAVAVAPAPAAAAPPVVEEPPVKAEAPVEKPSGPPAPPIRESLRLLQSVLSGAESTSSGKSAGTPGQPAAAGAVAPGAAAQATSSRALSQKDRRELARDAFERQHPEIKKLFGLLKDGSLRQHESLLHGESGAAPSGGEEHQFLLEWLILDPPEQADTRLAATKMAMRELPVDKAVDLFELCLYPGSPNEIEIRQCAELLLDLSYDSLSTDQVARLKALISKKS
jgi:hypothetical protein